MLKSAQFLRKFALHSQTRCRIVESTIALEGAGRASMSTAPDQENGRNGHSASPSGSCTEADDSMISRVLQIPESVRGMQQLDKERFRTRVLFPVIAVDPHEIGRLRGCTGKYVVKNLGRTIKTVVNAPDAPAKKHIVFNPNALTSSETREQLLTTVRCVSGDPDKHWEERVFAVGFDDWDMKSIFRAVLPDGLEYSAFTQTGHLIHCNFRDSLVPFRTIIGQILLEKVQNCRTVVYKPDQIKNQFRTFEVELIAGEPNYVVDTVEDGVRYRMDFTKVFWNSRLSREHARIMKIIEPNSLVFDACAGIGPFVIPVARKHNARLIWANDLNPESVRWMHENIKLNKIAEGAIRVFNQDAVEFVRGAVAEYIREQLKEYKEKPESRPSSANIIMNLPALAVTFLSAFRGMLRGTPADGSEEAKSVQSEETAECFEPFPVIVYCYLFAKAHEDVSDAWYPQRAREMAEHHLQWKGVRFRKIHEVRTVSKRKVMMCVECVLPWRMLWAEPLSEEERRKLVESIDATEQDDEEENEEEEEEGEEKANGTGDAPPASKKPRQEPGQ